MAEPTAPLAQLMCGGEWGEGGQNLDCSLRDLLFDTQFIAQVFDWQNAVFLLFLPLMLLISSSIFRFTYKAFGARGLDDVMKNVGELSHDTPMPYYPQERFVARSMVPQLVQRRMPVQAPSPAMQAERPIPVVLEPYDPRELSSGPVPMDFVMASPHRQFAMAAGSLSPPLISPPHANVAGAPPHLPPHQFTGQVPANNEVTSRLQPGTEILTPHFRTVQMYSGAGFGSAFGGPHEESEAVTRGLKVDIVKVQGSRFGVPPQIELQQLQNRASINWPIVTSNAIDRRNIAVMISIGGYIFSIGLICWASISDFASPGSEANSYAQGWATQGVRKGVEQRGINLAWGLFWLVFGAVLMTIAQLMIRKLVIGSQLDLVNHITEKGSVAVAIFEAGLQVSLGLVVAGAISGPPSSDGLGYDLAGALLFFALSLILLITQTLIFDAYFSHWSTWDELKKDNEAAAISNFFQMVCAGMLMANSVSKSFELTTFFAWYALGTMIRTFFRSVLDYCLVAPRFFSPRYSRGDLKIDRLILTRNWGAAVVVGMLQIVVTNVINSFVPGFCWEFVYSDGRPESLMTFQEKLSGTEFVLTIFRWDRIIALPLIFAVFISARAPFEWRLKMFASSDRNKNPSLAPVEEDLNYYIYENKLNAVTISFGAYLVAVGNSMSGVFSDGNYGVGFATSQPESWGWLVLQLAVGYVMVLATLAINDWLILHKFNNMEEIARRNNVAVALIEAGSLIGSSFVIEAVVHGWDYSEPAYASAIILFLASQALLFVFQRIFEAVTVYNDEAECQLGNAAAGLFNGLNLVAVGMLLGRSVYLSHSLITLLSWATITFPLIFIVHRVVDRIVFPSSQFEAAIECLDRKVPNIFHPRRSGTQGNWGVALVAGLISVSFANLLNTFLRDCVFLFGVPTLSAPAIP